MGQGLAKTGGVMLSQERLESMLARVDQQSFAKHPGEEAGLQPDYCIKKMESHIAKYKIDRRLIHLIKILWYMLYLFEIRRPQKNVAA